MVLWRPTRPFKTNIQKRYPFCYRGLECQSSKSRNTWSNRQIWPWSTEWSRAKANRVLPRKCTGHSKHLLPTIQEKTLYMDITRWSTPKSDWFYSLQPKMEKLDTVNKNKTRSWLWLRSWWVPQVWACAGRCFPGQWRKWQSKRDFLAEVVFFNPTGNTIQYNFLLLPVRT